MAPSTRQLSTSSRVYPSYLPYLHNLHAPRAPKNAAKLIPPAVALVGIGYGVSLYRQAQVERRASATSAAAQAEAERKSQNETLQEAYGDRRSLESLEEAMRVYEAQHRGQR